MHKQLVVKWHNIIGTGRECYVYLHRAQDTRLALKQVPIVPATPVMRNCAFFPPIQCDAMCLAEGQGEETGKDLASMRRRGTVGLPALLSQQLALRWHIDLYIVAVNGIAIILSWQSPGIGERHMMRHLTLRVDRHLVVNRTGN